MKVIRKYMDVDEFFRRANKSEIPTENFNRDVFYNMFDNFHGNQNEVYRRYAEHDVESYAGTMSTMVDSVNLDSMYERRWEFRSRLDCGDEVDVDRLMECEYETCWNGMRRALRGRQSVRIFVNFGGSFRRSPEELSIPGAIATSVAQALETIGIGADIYGVSGACECADNVTVMSIVKLKGVDQYADFGMIGYVCGDSHVYRNTGFINWIETCSENGIKPNRNLGYEASMSAKNLGIDDDELGTRVIIPQIFEVSKAVEWLRGSFASILGKFKQ